MFWIGVEVVINDLVLKNKVLFVKCDEFQVKIDGWYQVCVGQVYDVVVYKVFFEEIGYLLFEVEDFQVGIQNVDDEIVCMVGLQLVVLVMNVCFVLNVFNVCWGLLYDVFYGIDVISEEGGVEKGKGYNKVCGDKVIVFVCVFFDEVVLLEFGFYVDVIFYSVKNGVLVVVLKNGSEIGLKNVGQFFVFQGDVVKL